MIYRIPHWATTRKPIETKGMTMSDLEKLKKVIFQIMNEGLRNLRIDSEEGNLISEKTTVHSL